MSDTTWRPDLHERLARRDDRRTRAFRSAAAAALVAAIGWFADLSVAWHVASVAVAALAGALWPVRRSVLEAFRTIAEQAGLAYQTHLEHRGGADPYGLLQAAETQARLSVRGVVPPARSAWWLPLASLAVALVVLTAFTGGPASWLRGATGVPDGGVSGTPPSAPPPVTDLAREQADDPTASDATEPPAAPEQADAPSEADDRGPGGGADEAAEAADGAGGLEREALDRFLESLRERPRVSESAGALSDADRDGVRDDADADLAEAEVRGEVEEAPDDRDRTPDGRGDETGEGERSVEVPAGNGETDDVGDEAADLDDGVADGTGPGPDPDAEQGEDGAAEADEQPGEAPTTSSEGAPDEDDGTAGFGPEQGELDAGTGDEAGVGPGTPMGQDDQVPPPAGELEALPGMLGPGPETLGGRVRLPGRDSDLAPTPSAAERFERAIEQAVTDGSVPVSFQEIIRNYFR